MLTCNWLPSLWMIGYAVRVCRCLLVCGTGGGLLSRPRLWFRGCLLHPRPGAPSSPGLFQGAFHLHRWTWHGAGNVWNRYRHAITRAAALLDPQVRPRCQHRPPRLVLPRLCNVHAVEGGVLLPLLPPHGKPLTTALACGSIGAGLLNGACLAGGPCAPAGNTCLMTGQKKALTQRVEH